jgi:hypothetical protein
VLAVLAVAVSHGALAAPVDEGWRPLFNGKDLSGWETFLSYQPETGTQDPLGVNKDPEGIFSVKDGAIRVQGRVWGALTTLEEFENYTLRLEFKWGEKRWPPRDKAKRDSGVLYHAVGPHGAQSGHWMRSFESQVQEGDCGDFHSLNGVTIDVEAQTVEADGGKHLKYTPGSPLVRGVKQRVLKSEDAEKPGAWNVMEVVARGDSVEHRVNGRVVLRASGLKQTVDGRPVPLTKGRIQIQSEGAEVYYRKIEIKPLDLRVRR